MVGISGKSFKLLFLTYIANINKNQCISTCLPNILRNDVKQSYLKVLANWPQVYLYTGISTQEF